MVYSSRVLLVTKPEKLFSKNPAGNCGVPPTCLRGEMLECPIYTTSRGELSELSELDTNIIRAILVGLSSIENAIPRIVMQYNAGTDHLKLLYFLQGEILLKKTEPTIIVPFQLQLKKSPLRGFADTINVFSNNKTDGPKMSCPDTWKKYFLDLIKEKIQEVGTPALT